MARPKLKLLVRDEDITTPEQLEAVGRRGKRRLWRSLAFLVLGFGLYLALGGMWNVGPHPDEPSPRRVFGTFVAEQCFREPIMLGLTWRCEGTGIVPGREPEHAQTYNSMVTPQQIGEPVRLERLEKIRSSGKDQVYWVDPDRGSLPRYGTYSLLAGFAGAFFQFVGGVSDRVAYRDNRKKWAGEAAEDQQS